MKQYEVTNIRKDRLSGAGNLVRLEGVKLEIRVTYLDGELELLPPLDMEFIEFAKILQKFYEGESDFIPRLEEYFKGKISSMFFIFNGIGITVTEENSNWYDTLKAFTIGWEKAKYPRSFVIKLDEETDMQFKNETARERWKKAVEKSSSMRTLDVSRRWAKMMQYYMEVENQKLEEIVELAYDEAKLDEDVGSTIAFATNNLVQCWKYGDELKAYFCRKKEKTA